jgi:hypothetical protein
MYTKFFFTKKKKKQEKKTGQRAQSDMGFERGLDNNMLLAIRTACEIHQ